MASIANNYTDYPVIPARRVYSWAGIFAGTFMFIAIETTFGILGASIFGSSGIGIDVWMIILSIIALYFAGKTSSKMLVRPADRTLGAYHGLVTFGMSIIATILVVAVSYNSGSAAVAMHTGSVIGYVGAGGEYWLFVALVLSMISAAIGGMHGIDNSANVGVPATERTTGSRNVA